MSEIPSNTALPSARSVDSGGSMGVNAFLGEQGMKCSAFEDALSAPTRSPESSAGSQQMLSKRRKRWTCQDTELELGKCRHLLTRGPLVGCREARHGILGLGGHPPLRAFPASGDYPLGQSPRV